MATRRMFSKNITNSSKFLMMPQTAQNLYFHLGMNADDDGFVEHFTVMRMVEAKPDDLNILMVRGFIKVFDDKVLIILDWKENNYLRSDRYTPSKYLKTYEAELKGLASGIPSVYQGVTQDRLGKDRLNIDIENLEKTPVNSYVPTCYEESAIKTIAITLGEEYMDFLLSVYRKYGFALIEDTYGIYKETRSEIKDPAAYFNTMLTTEVEKRVNHA